MNFTTQITSIFDTTASSTQFKQQVNTLTSFVEPAERSTYRYKSAITLAHFMCANEDELLCYCYGRVSIATVCSLALTSSVYRPTLYTVFVSYILICMYSFNDCSVYLSFYIFSSFFVKLLLSSDSLLVFKWINSIVCVCMSQYLYNLPTIYMTSFLIFYV